MALDVSKAFGRVWHVGLPQKLKSHGVLGQIFGLISSFVSNTLLSSFKMLGLNFCAKLDWGS